MAHCGIWVVEAPGHGLHVFDNFARACQLARDLKHLGAEVHFWEL